MTLIINSLGGACPWLTYRQCLSNTPTTPTQLNPIVGKAFACAAGRRMCSKACTESGAAVAEVFPALVYKA
ncbi:hypothetical protein EWM62_02320 [Mucilaginibacter terrigena]|uniref:Uncharacterized protein n=1 Tax=Mucilaginibacter terrigena TaxID=2492395 RepID=A0A4Q5LRZ8_9SPHI|nr:hypothetical protein [Mucilaginibacter terrigena]RYU92292.1 hypothetical protein EWM62_02320 [Mucilaginibacter terrigena]